MPFPGLRPYQPSESDLFFGRHEQIDELLDKLDERRIVAVVGISGSGKSSLVRAGLIPSLERGFLGVTGSRWRVAILNPGVDPVGELCRSVGGALGVNESSAMAELERSSFGVVELTKSYLPEGENLLIFVDQFEEVFRYQKDSARRDQREASTAFVKLLLTAAGRSEVPVAEIADLPIFVVLTMRSDYLGKSSEFRGLPEALNDSQYLVPRMTRDQIKEAIEGPISMSGARITPRLVQRLLNDAGDNPGRLPVLQHALKRTWDVSLSTRSKHEPLDLEHYEHPSVQGMEKALNLDANDAFASLNGDHRKEDVARRLFQRLVEPGAEEEESRRPTRLSELSEVCKASGTELHEAMSPFLQRGFLVLSRGRYSQGQDPIVDISHESLIRLWDQLKTWSKQESISAAIYTRLADWVTAGFPLYTGRALEEALAWRDTPGLNNVWARRYRPEQTIFQRSIDFLNESRRVAEEAIEREREKSKREEEARLKASEDAIRQQEHRHRTELELRRTKSIVLVVAMAAIILSALVLYAFRETARATDQARIASEQARFATAGQLLLTALSNKDTRLDIAALIGIERRKLIDDFGASDVLLSTLQAASPELLAFLNHHAEVSCVSFSPNGKILASVTSDGALQLWSVEQRRELGEPLRGHPQQLNGVAFSPDGKIVAAGGSDKTVQLWDVATKKAIGEPLTGHLGRVWSIAFSPDGKVLASSSSDKTVRLWAVETGTSRTLSVSSTIWRVAFSPDGKILALAGSDRSIQLWDLAATPHLIGRLLGHKSLVTSVAFSPDGSKIVSGSEDQTVRLWDVKGRSPLGKPLLGHTAFVTDVKFSPDGQSIASTSYDRSVKLWNVKEHRFLRDLNGHFDRVWSVAFSPDGSLLASSSSDKTVRLWNPTAKGQLLEFSARQRDNVTAVSFSPDGKRVASGSHDQIVRIWNLGSGQLERSLQGHTDIITSLAFSPDGRVLASAGYDCTIRLWDVADGKPLAQPFTGHLQSINGIAFSPDGRMLASASSDHFVGLWDIARGNQSFQPLRGHSDIVTSVAFSPDNKSLASAGYDGTLRIWDVNRGKELGPPITGQSDKITSVAFSPDGKMIATGGYDRTVRLWNPVSRKMIGDPLTGHSGIVTSVAFGIDSRMLASEVGTPRYICGTPCNTSDWGNHCVVTAKLSPASALVLMVGRCCPGLTTVTVHTVHRLSNHANSGRWVHGLSRQERRGESEVGIGYSLV